MRQILGWREFVYWQYWRQMPGMKEKNGWEAHRPVPPFFWSGETDMACLRHAIRRALETGYNHHIERLMLLSNFAMLAGLNPAAVNDWFSALYIDAYDWVMPPNVIGMGLNADGGLTATKPYIASANYINKMGDHCAGCRFNPKQRHGARCLPLQLPLLGLPHPPRGAAARQSAPGAQRPRPAPPGRGGARGGHRAGSGISRRAKAIGAIYLLRAVERYRVYSKLSIRPALDVSSQLIGCQKRHERRRRQESDALALINAQNMCIPAHHIPGVFASHTFQVPIVGRTVLSVGSLNITHQVNQPLALLLPVFIHFHGHDGDRRLPLPYPLC